MQRNPITSRLLFLVLALSASFSLTAWATEDEGNREQRSAQLIYNTVNMSSDAGEPAAAVIAQYRKRGSTSHGVGYRTQAVAQEDGKPLVWSFQVAYLNDAEAVQMTEQFVVENLAPNGRGEDPETGAGMYVLPGAGAGANRVWFVLLVGNLSLNMTIDRTERDPEEALRKSLRRWHFFISEAKRLGILEEMKPPSLIVKVWDPETEDWRSLGQAEAFSQRLADLHAPETLFLEVEAKSDLMTGDQPYTIELKTARGGEELRLLSGDGAELSDSDGDGWAELVVQPVDGVHPPQRLLAEFRAKPEQDESPAQKAVTAIRYRDASGEVEQDNILERSFITLVVTHFELRPKQQSAQFRFFPPRGMSEEERQEYERTGQPPVKPEWFNGEFDQFGDMALNWSGDFDISEDNPEGTHTPGFSDFVRLYPATQLPANRAELVETPRSQAAVFGESRPKDVVYLGWTLEPTSGQKFLTMEDRTGAPLEIAPLQSHESADIYLDLWIAEDVVESYDPSAANGLGPQRNPQELQNEIRQLLEVDVLQMSVWLVDDLADLKDANGAFPALSEELFPRLKEGLRKETKEPVMVRENTPLVVFQRNDTDSYFLDTYFPKPLVPLVNNLSLMLDPGIYELQLDLVLQERDHRDIKHAVNAGLRFWVWEAPPMGEQRVIQGIETQRTQSFRHEMDPEMLEAAQAGDLERLAQAIQAGADVNAVDEHGATALGWAASNGREEVIRALLQAGADVHWQAERGQTALNVAAAQGYDKIVRLLVESGADVNERITAEQAPDNLRGATPLIVAALHNQPDTAKTLIQLGADVNAKNKDGSTALFFIAEAGRSAMAELLIDAGADVMAKNKWGATPLLAAVASESPEAIWLLVDAGADPNVRASDLNPPPYGGMTPLAAAAHEGMKHSVLALLLAGADPSVKTADGLTAYDVAVQGGHEAVIDILRDPDEAKQAARKAFEEDLVDAAMDRRWDYVRLLTKRGIDINARDEEGMTALMKAAEEGELDVAKGLLDAGADVHAKDSEYGATALMIAAFHGRNDVLRALIDAGGDPSAKAVGDDKGEIAGWTPLMLAAHAGHAHVVSQLLVAGADPRIVNNAGQTALEIAQEEKAGNFEAIIALLKGALGASDRGGSETTVTWDFETGTLMGWSATGDAFADQPTYGDNPTARQRHMPSKHQGDYWIGSYEKRPHPSDPPGQTQGDGPKGTLTSQSFTIEGPSLSFLIGGGCDLAVVRAELLVQGEVVRKATGKCSETMERVAWDLSDVMGKMAQIRLVDDSSGGWGHINFDDVRF